MSERYSRQIRRECRRNWKRSIKQAVCVIKTHVEHLGFTARLKIAVSIFFRKKFEEKELYVK